MGDIRIDNIKTRIERAKTYGLDPGISLRDIEYLLECIAAYASGCNCKLCKKKREGE